MYSAYLWEFFMLKVEKLTLEAKVGVSTVTTTSHHIEGFPPPEVCDGHDVSHGHSDTARYTSQTASSQSKNSAIFHLKKTQLSVKLISDTLWNMVMIDRTWKETH